MYINTIRDSHVPPKYFLLCFTSLPYQVVEIGSEDDLGVRGNLLLYLCTSSHLG